MPVRAVASDTTINIGSSRPAPPRETMRCTTVATFAAMTTEVELSGPATANGRELRHATIAPPTAADKNIAATP
jgi:hypothetical protein